MGKDNKENMENKKETFFSLQFIFSILKMILVKQCIKKHDMAETGLV